jgi:hypothetical protein
MKSIMPQRFIKRLIPAGYVLGAILIIVFLLDPGDGPSFRLVDLFFIGVAIITGTLLAQVFYAHISKRRP